MSGTSSLGPALKPSMELREATFSYPSGFVLGPITLTIDPGVLCLVGANGTGKSTLFSLLSGQRRWQRGESETADEVRVGLLPQSPLFPRHATCEDFLSHVAWLNGVHRKVRSDAVAQALTRVDLTDRAQDRIGTLSGGMQRRLGIAQAIVHEPDVLLLDEPTAGLDPAQRVSLRELVRNLGGSHAVVISTHLVEDVRSVADKVVVLVEGRIEFEGTVRALEALEDPSLPGDTTLERAVARVVSGGAR